MPAKKPDPAPRRQRLQRKAALKITLSQEILTKLVALSDVLGLPTATLGSLAVGQYVAQQERSLGFVSSMQDQLTEIFKGELQNQLTEQIPIPK